MIITYSHGRSMISYMRCVRKQIFVRSVLFFLNIFGEAGEARQKSQKKSNESYSTFSKFRILLTFFLTINNLCIVKVVNK